MKKITFLTTVIILCLFAIYRFAKSETDNTITYAPVNREQAFEKTKALFAGVDPQSIKYQGIRNRKDFPPFTPCHLFEIPLDGEDYPDITKIKDPDAPGGYRKIVKPAEQMKGFVYVEVESGRILRFIPNPAYSVRKNINRFDADRNNLMSKDEVLKMAEKYLAISGIDLNGFEITSDMNMMSSKKVLNNVAYYLYEYLIQYTKYTNIEGSKIYLPTTILMSIDPRTGELNDMLYKDYPLKIELYKPAISSEEALNITKNYCKLDDMSAAKIVLMVHLKDPFNDNFDDNQVLSWRIRNIKKDKNPVTEIWLNADTGEIIDVAAILAK